MRRGLPRKLLIGTAWSVGGLLTLILLLIGALLVVGNTDTGRDFVVRMTSRLTKGNVQIAGIHGDRKSVV